MTDGARAAHYRLPAADASDGSHQRRWRVEVAYDGTDFSGWASQPGLRTVQQTLEAALTMVLRLPAVSLTVAGRTDAGVHAQGQVCHVDLPVGVLGEHRNSGERGGPLDAPALTRRLASVLPGDLRVRDIVPAAQGFDARFSALWRRYAYRICDVPQAADPLRRREVLTWPRRLDEVAMNCAASLLLGEHDFAAFCKARKGATTIRTLLELGWTRSGDTLTARVVADAFCHSMVRALIGCLVAVGEGRKPVEWPLSVLISRTRDPGVRVLPPTGLTLEAVGYPSDDLLALRAGEARAVRRLSSSDVARDE
ncbi:MAG: tRNA pseudouridine(38-40) synthase TruA [Nocardioidaceae bacterium]